MKNRRPYLILSLNTNNIRLLHHLWPSVGTSAVRQAGGRWLRESSNATMKTNTQDCTAVERATRLFQAGFTQPALDVIEIALGQSPNDGYLYLLQATILHAQQDWAEALAAMETASSIVPLTKGGQLVLADCYSYLGKHDLALTAYRHLLLQPALDVDLYAGLYAGFKRAGRLDLALESCRQAVAISHDNHEAYFAMAHCMASLSYASHRVTAVLRKALDLAPDVPCYRLSLVAQLDLTKQQREAYQVLAARPVEFLDVLRCPCLVRQLLYLCIWAGDIERSSHLGGMLARFNQGKTDQQSVSP